MESGAAANHDAKLCCYPSKPCQNPRVVKRNGGLHRFCEFHRMKANFNQRRLEKRRQLEHQLQYEMDDAQRHQIMQMLDQLKLYQRHSPPPAEFTMDEEDIQIVEEFLQQHDLMTDFDEDDQRFMMDHFANSPVHRQ